MKYCGHTIVQSKSQTAQLTSLNLISGSLETQNTSEINR